VDLENHAIRIPKTKSGRIRIVNINAILSSVLQTLKSTNGSSLLLFPNPKTGLALKSVRTAFKAACRRAEIKGLRFHDLRHTFASRLVRMGVDLITVKEILGHSSVTTTERYTHTLQEQKQRAVDLLAGAESGKNAASLLHICDTERRVKKAGSLSHSNQIN
jgi:integrase